jgi:hypothetical protein
MPYVKPNPKAKKSDVSKGTVAKQVASGAKKAASGTKNYIRDEMLGFDDFGRVADKAKKGDVLGAAKSGLTGIGELGLTAASLVAGFFSGGAGTVGVQAAKAGAKQAVKTAAGTQAAKTVDKVVINPPKFGPQFGGKPPAGDWNPYRPVKPTQTPLKPIPGGGGSAPKGGTTVVEAPPATKPDFNPLKDTKPFDPFNPKTNPWPGMPKVDPKINPKVDPKINPKINPNVEPKVDPKVDPKVEPKVDPKPAPAPAPAPKPEPAPAPKPKKPKTTTPWKPTGTVKPDAAKPGGKVSTNPGTEVKPQTELKPTTGVSRKVAFGTGAAAAIGLAALLPKPKTSDDKPWNPSSIV